MKTKKLYTCGTVWHSDAHPDNSGQLEFYASPEACHDDNECADSCGVVEVTATFDREVIPANDEKVRYAADRKEQERQFIPLATKIEKLLAKAEPDIAMSAVEWVLGGLKREQRKKRMKKRLSKAKK